MKPAVLFLLVSFLVVQLAALGLGYSFIEQQVSIVDDPESVENSVFFFAYVVFAAAVLLLILHFYKGKKLFYFIELLLVFTAFNIVFALFFDELTALGAGIAAVALRALKPQSKKYLMLGATATVGALLGSSLDLIPAAVFAVLLAGYDFVAVFITKHMVTLATQLEDRETSFTIGFGEQLPKGAKVSTTGQKKGNVKTVSFIELGTGDLVIPAMLASGALKTGVFPNWTAGLAAAIGGAIGLFTILYLLDKQKEYLPALPPIVFFSLLFILLQILVTTHLGL